MIEVVSTGMYTSLQDGGREGYRALGVPLSGPMDRFSAYLAQQLVGNTGHEAFMEFARVGPILHFKKTVAVAFTGAGFTPSTERMILPLNRMVTLSEGTFLNIGKAKRGMYGYMSVRSGIKSPEVLGSSSYFKGITQQHTVHMGQVLECDPLTEPSMRHVHLNLNSSHVQNLEILAHKGPEFHLLSEHQKAFLLDNSHQVSAKSNRMGIRFKDNAAAGAKEILTSPVQPGTVQMTPSGQLIALMRDAQTTGGYARVLQLTNTGINTLAQKSPKTKIRFVLI